MDIKVTEDTVVVFDLDDTIYNEIEYLKSAYMAIAKELDSGAWKPLLLMMFSMYRNKMDVFEWVAGEYGCGKQVLLEKYRTHFPNITPFEGVIQVIKKVKKRGGLLAVLTDGRVSTQMNKVKALGLEGLIDHVAISESIGSEKPDPASYIYIERYFNKLNYYYIGDNLRKDFVAPNALGWQTIGLMDNGLNIHHDQFKYWTEGNRPQALIENYSALRVC